LDYSGVVAGSVVLKAGAMSVDLLVNVLDDQQDEQNETVDLAITGAAVAEIVEPDTFSLVILDNDAPPVFNFSQAESNVEEGSGALTLNVVLSMPSNLTTSVDFSYAGSAVLGQDFDLLTSGPLTFAPGVTSQSIQLNINDDQLFTGSREVVFTLINPQNAIVGLIPNHTVNIIENEICPTLTGWTTDGKNAYTTASLPTSAPAVTLTSLTVTQQSGQQLRSVDLGTNNTLFQGNAAGSPVTITNFKGGADLTMSGAGGGKILLLTFQDVITLTGSYSVSLTWSNGCVVGKP
jgi:hypothetical protein